MNRALFLIHRYLGIALGVVLSVWCLSGVVMMYVQYPELTAEDEVRGLEPLEIASCCRLPQTFDGIAEQPLEDLRIEMMAGRPVLRLALATGERRQIDLAHGKFIDGVDEHAAAAVADDYARTAGIQDFAYAGLLARDQWTVYGAYDVHRPLYKFVGDDAASTEWYVSSTTGEVIQATMAGERFWNWLGAVPHWLYPTLLRQHVMVWSQTVIWLTIFATFLTVIGFYVGIRQLRSRRSGRYSPYRGAAMWHHYIGLVFGTFTLTWLVSGFFSMNPWGVLESRSFAADEARYQGDELLLDEALQRDVQSLAGQAFPNGTVRLQANVVNGERFFVAWAQDGNRTRLDQAMRAVYPVVQSVFARAASVIKPGTEVLEQGWINEDDAYYYSHHEKRPLPVYRLIYADGERFYLDQLTGKIAHAVDTNSRLYRWLHYGLHRGDFTRSIRARPVWDVLMLPLMIAVSLGALTGTWMGLRRVRRWFRV